MIRSTIFSSADGVFLTARAPTKYPTVGSNAFLSLSEFSFDLALRKNSLAAGIGVKGSALGAGFDLSLHAQLDNLDAVVEKIVQDAMSFFVNLGETIKAEAQKIVDSATRALTDAVYELTDVYNKLSVVILQSTLFLE